MVLIQVLPSKDLQLMGELACGDSFGQFLIENLSFSNSLIFGGVDKLCQYFTCFSGMGGASVVDYLIGDPNSFCNSIFDFFIGNKQNDSYSCPLFFKIRNNVCSRPPTSFSQGQILYPSPKKANQYVINIKYELAYVQGEIYTSLDNHNQGLPT